MKTLLIALTAFFAHNCQAGEFGDLRSAIVAATLAHIKAHPPKGNFTLAQCATYQFENASAASPEIIEAILAALPVEQAGRHIPFNLFPTKQKFPLLEGSPEEKIEFYYLGPLEYVNETEINVIVGYSPEQLKWNQNKYSLSKENESWKAISISFNF